MLHRDTQSWEDAIHAQIPLSDPDSFTWPASQDGDAELRAARLARESHKPRSAATNFAAWLLTRALLVEPTSYIEQHAAAQAAQAEASALAEAVLKYEPYGTTTLNLSSNDGTAFHLRRLATESEVFAPLYDMFVSSEDEQKSIAISFEAPTRALKHYQQISEQLQAIAASRQANQLFA